MSLAAPWTLPDLQKPGRGARIDWSSPLARGLVLAPLFAENGGTIANEPAGGHTATLNGSSPLWQVGPHGAVPHFDGSTNDVTFSGVTGFGTLVGTSSDFTVSLWAMSTNPAGSRQTILGDWDSSGANNSFEIEFGGYLQTAGHITTGVYGGNYLDSGVIAVANDLYHIVVTHVAATQARKIYINGQLAASDTPTQVITAGTHLTLGRGGDQNALYLSGSIDLPLIYTRVLSPSQIAQLADPGTAYSMFERAIVRRWAGFTPTGGTTVNLAATGGGIATGTADLSLFAPLTADGGGQASGTAALSLFAPLSATGGGQADGSATASLSRFMNLAATGGGVAAGTADLSAYTYLTGNGGGVASGTAALWMFSARGGGQANGVATLSGGRAIGSGGAIPDLGGFGTVRSGSRLGRFGVH